MRLSCLSVVLSTVLLGACIVEAPGGTSDAERRQATVQQVPPLALKSGANLGGKVELVGGSVTPGRIVKGEPARVTVFFKVLQPILEDYTIFVHLEDSEGKMERMNIDHKPSGGIYPTTQWKPGETVRDDFNVYIPPGSSVRSVTLWMGLWEPRSDTRMKLTNPDAVRNDGKDRILLAQIPVAP
jgi:hypothetical protein